MKSSDQIEKQTIKGIREIYLHRKKIDGDTLKILAAEIGVSTTCLHDSINGKFTSGKTLKLFRAYLKGNKLVTQDVQ
jgi:hypothetical protein